MVPDHFCGLLTHSGSRGVGYAIASHYMRLAAQETARHAQVPKMYEWLDLDGAAGQEYWQAMELAGAFAQAKPRGDPRRIRAPRWLDADRHYSEPP